MKDKVQKIREEVVRMHNLLPVTNGDNIYLNYADRICTTLEMYIDSMQEESIHRTQADIDAAMAEVEEKSKAFTEAHKGETAEEILAQMRGEEPVSEDLENAAVEWFNSVKYKSDLSGTPINAFIVGAQWQKEHLMKDAVDGLVTFDYYGNDNKTYGCIAHDPICLDDMGLKDTDKVKMILIKED